MFQPCLPTPRKRAPSGPAWVHEIKHDGYRLIVRCDGDRVRLYTRRGYNWSGRYPRIIEAVHRLKVRSIVIDGEAVVIGDDGRADFDRLHTGAMTAMPCCSRSTCSSWTATTGARAR
jgi:bifunctional non-homologous end joining protein LigD